MKEKSIFDKRILAVIIFAIIMIAVAVPALAIDVKLDGQNLKFTEDYGFPFIDDANRTQVPFRMTMEAYGCEVSWDAAAKTAIASKNGITVKVPIGKNYIYVNGKTVQNDTKAVIVNSRTYLPIRAVLEAFGAYVSWDSNTQTVIVGSDGINPSAKPVLQPGNNLKIHFIDVGQGDCILIDYGQTEILIDGGPVDAGDEVTSYISDYVDGKLDYVVVTHFDEDHVGGLLSVYQKYGSKLGKVIYSGEDYYPLLDKLGIPRFAANMLLKSINMVEDSDMTIKIDNKCQLKIIETGDNYSNNNDSSVIVELIYGDFKALFTGDMSSTVEKANLSKFEAVDVLKVGHHGARTSTSAEFLSKIKPETAIISYKLNNPHGHPQYLAVERLLNAGATIYGTGKSGTIVLETDGTAYELDTNQTLTLADAADMVNTNTVINPLPEGGYYLGNKTTLRLHLSTCENGQNMATSNRVIFDTREEAIAAGYIPCKVCCP